MNKIKYYARVIGGSSLKRMTHVINDVHKKSGQNRVYTFFDMLNCAIRYGAGYHDYNIFAFYNIKHDKRKTYVTRVRNKKIISMVNNEEIANSLFEHKSAFNVRFKDYLKREFLVVKDMELNQFKTFMKEKEIIFAKPDVGESGKGIERLKKSDYKTLEEMFRYIKDKEFGVIEEEIIQHEAMSNVYPHSINALRIVTIVVDHVPHCVYVTSKWGNEGKFVDNIENSGLCVPVDMETGKLYGLAHTSPLIPYECHPYTNFRFEGYEIPYVKEAVQLVLKAAMEVEEVGFVGWDVAITKDGPIIIEGNPYPGYDFWQLPEQTPDRLGIWPYYKNLLPKL